MTRATSHTSVATLNLHAGVVFDRVSGADLIADDDLLRECCALYSANYGIWGPTGPRPGEQIAMTPTLLSPLLKPAESRVAYARNAAGELIAYCTAVCIEVAGLGRVDWATQLVVAEAYRSERVATQLIHSLWGFSDSYAWGLATANPFAVRALETATRRACRKSAIRQHGPAVLSALSKIVDYLPPTLLSRDSTTLPIVDTEFPVDHSDVAGIRSKAARGNRPWDLGTIAPGEEWFACTFRSQAPSALTPEQLDALLRGADRVWLDAYARMALGAQHAWHKYGEDEVSLLQTYLPAHARTVLDVGCGDGRHSALFAQAGFDVTAIDVVPELIDSALTHAPAGIDFRVADARRGIGVPPESFDVALLLYDVLGSSATPSDDAQILANVLAALRPGGILALSVMNSEVSLGRLPESHRPQGVEAFVRALENLPPSKTMEQTGDVFDPSLLLFYDGVFYRKEQFEDTAARLPVEHVVRDRRFTPEEIRNLVVAAGLEVELLRPVRAGAWATEVGVEDGKEILVVARKPTDAAACPKRDPIVA